MDTVRINTTQNIEIGYEFANVFQRIMAFIIDLLLIAISIALINLLMLEFSGSMTMVNILLGILAYVYFFIMELLLQGQTVGKIAMRIKVVKLDGSRPGIGAYLLRWVMIPLDDFLLSGGVAISLIIFTQNAQRLGDLLGGTTVVKSVHRTEALRRSRQVINSVSDDYQPQFPEARKLDDNDVHLIEGALKAYRLDRQAEPAFRLSQKLTEKLNIQNTDPPLIFLQRLLKDYYYYAAHQQNTL